jgi:uncharacterized FAD-dependent dehydrogenase
MIRIHEIKIKIGAPNDSLPKRLEEKCRLKKLGYKIVDWRVSRESVDARDKENIRFVYSVDFCLNRCVKNDSDGSLVRSASDIQTQTPMSETSNTEAEEVFVNRLKRIDPGIRIELLQDNEFKSKYTGEDIARKSGAETCLEIKDESVQTQAAAALRRSKIRPPVIAGFGPCGMFAGLILAEKGLEPIILERGKPVEKRIQDVERFWKEGRILPESNVQFGEGGAGTFSDGKLTTGINDQRIRRVLEELVLAGGGDELLYKQKAHIGTDKLRLIVKNIRKKIIDLGGTVLFSHKLIGIEIHGDKLVKILVESPNGGLEIHADFLVLATGHSARDTLRILHGSGLEMAQKPFSMGLRIEHPQSMINSAQYGAEFNRIYGKTPEEAGLPPADYKLSCKASDGRGVYTFCMCPGGEVIAASSHEGMTVTNGMSYSARNGKRANSALLVDVRTSDYRSEHPLAGLEFQERFERLAYKLSGSYMPPKESVGDFIGPDSILVSCLPEFSVSGIREALPYFERKLEGFSMPSALLYGVESRSSSPVRILRNSFMRSGIKGLYPGGEGSGYAGGIMSAAVDGIKIAEIIAGE